MAASRYSDCCHPPARGQLCWERGVFTYHTFHTCNCGLSVPIINNKQLKCGNERKYLNKIRLNLFPFSISLMILNAESSLLIIIIMPGVEISSYLGGGQEMLNNNQGFHLQCPNMGAVVCLAEECYGRIIQLDYAPHYTLFIQSRRGRGR